jgi:hypothetical protein
MIRSLFLTYILLSRKGHCCDHKCYFYISLKITVLRSLTHKPNIFPMFPISGYGFLMTSLDHKRNFVLK